MSVLLIKAKEEQVLALVRRYGRLLKKKHNHKKRREVLNKLRKTAKELVEI